MSRKKDALALLQQYGVRYTPKKSSIALAADQITALNKTMQAARKPEHFDAFYNAFRFAVTQKENTPFKANKPKQTYEINDKWLGEFIDNFETRKNQRPSLVDEVSPAFVPKLVSADSSPKLVRRDSSASDVTANAASATGSSDELDAPKTAVVDAPASSEEEDLINITRQSLADYSPRIAEQRARSDKELGALVRRFTLSEADLVRQRSTTMAAAPAVVSPASAQEVVPVVRSKSFSVAPPAPVTSPYLAPLTDLQIALEAFKAEIEKVTDDQFPNKEDLIFRTLGSIRQVAVYVDDEPVRSKWNKGKPNISSALVTQAETLLQQVDAAITASSAPKALTGLAMAAAVVKAALLNLVTLGLINVTKSGRDYVSSMFFKPPSEKERAAAAAIKTQTEAVTTSLTNFTAMK